MSTYIRPIRLAVVQPLIPAYRVPVFARLAAAPEIDLTLWAGASRGSLASQQTDCPFKCLPAPMHKIGGSKLSFKWQAIHLSLMLGRRYDAVILSWDAHYLSLLPALILAKIRRIPVALWGHGYSKRGHGVRDAIRNWYGGRADAVILYTHSIAEKLIAQGYDARRVFVAQNAIDQEPIRRARDHWLKNPERLLGFRSRHGLDPDQTILFVSRLEPDNHLDLLIDGFAAHLGGRGSAKLVIIGDGSDRARLESMVAARGIETRVVFTGAIYEEDEIAPWMLSATVCCYPANIGLSVLHAFGYGLPVITHDNIDEQNPEVEALIHERTGLFYKQGDIADMMRQCERVLDDPALLRHLSENGLELVTQDYTVDTMVEGFVQVARFLASR